MKYIVELKKGRDIIDLCYTVKDVGKVLPMEYKQTIGKVLGYIEEEIRFMPLSGCKLRLLEIKNILDGGKNE